LLIGAEMHPTDAAPVVLWATDRKSYGRLSRLITVGRRRAEKGKCQLTLADVAEHAEGLIAGIVGCMSAAKCTEARVQSPRLAVQQDSSRFKVQSSRLDDNDADALSTLYSVPSTEYQAAADAKPNLHLFHPDDHQPFIPYVDIFPGRSY